MPKMTTEQFLSHLGIEVGKPFIAKVDTKETKLVVKVYADGEHYIERVSDGVLFSNIGYLLDEEITLLPKYTLTEDEKAIVRNMSYAIMSLGKDGSNIYGHIENRDPFWLPFENMFNFIGQGIKEEVSLDELRKCL